MPTGVYIRKPEDNKRRGRPKSEDFKKEMSLRMKGNKHASGCKHTEEMNNRKSENLKDQYLNGRIPGMLGKKQTEEWKKNMSERQMGHDVSDETKRKISEKAKGRKHSECIKNKISCNRKGKGIGKENGNWFGGKSFEFYGREFNNKLKEQIRKRDDYKCMECKYSQEKLKEKLTIHHIDYNKRNNDPNNLISLCRACHSQTNYTRSAWTRYFKEVNKGK